MVTVSSSLFPFDAFPGQSIGLGALFFLDFTLNHVVSVLVDHTRRALTSNRA